MTFLQLKSKIKVHVIRITKGIGITMVVDAIALLCREYCENKLEQQRERCWEEALEQDGRGEAVDAVKHCELVEID